MFEKTGGSLALTSLNHISLVCCSVEKSLDFYQNVLGFFPIRRPGSFDFDGAWLFSYGIGIHLLQSEDPESMPKKSVINPKDNHISFQIFTDIKLKSLDVVKIFDKFMFVGKCESMNMVEKKLKEMCIEYVKRRVEEGGIFVDQIFFHDPDGFMIEICNCDNLPVVPLAGEPIRVCGRVSFKNFPPHQQQKQTSQMVQCLPTIRVNEDYSSPCA